MVGFFLSVGAEAFGGFGVANARVPALVQRLAAKLAPRDLGQDCPGNRGDLATLNSDRLREKAEFGFLICTSLETRPMRDEIAAAGKFRHPLLNREDDRLQVITVAELFAPRNVRLDLPMARSDAVKAAAAQGDADKQMGLL